MSQVDIIVVGAGACGLMIARKLSQVGKHVLVIEARNRLGGRIHTIEEPGFLMPVEAGPEFVHGDLPVTLDLLKEANISVRPSGGNSLRSVNGKLQRDDDPEGEDDLLTKKLNELQEDITVAAFLEKNFSGKEHDEIRQTVKGFVEGYDAADINRASTLTLKQEWEDINDSAQHRVNGGYVRMIRFLETECKKHGGVFELSTVVKEVNWKAGRVEVVTANHQRYTASKIIITVPLGILCAAEHSEAAIKFSPALSDKENLLKALGYGGVIKILILFNHAFWKEMAVSGGGNAKDLGWLFSGEPIPTWWTQAPDDNALLTGWLAGTKAEAFREADDSKILEAAIASLATIFNSTTEALEKMIIHSKVENWLADPFSLGAYSYATPQTREAAKRISIPVQDTIFFAGEALYDSDEIGTVEAALANGLHVAGVVLDGE